MRTIVVGDIHGCSKALRSLLELIAPSADDQLVFLGDYVDRGPDSKGVIQVLIELQHQCRPVFLLGNHEIMFRGALRGLDPRIWLHQGGQQTLTSYGGLVKNVGDSHRDFLQACVPYHETDNALFVHANYLAELPLSEQPEDVLFWQHLSDRMPQPHHSGKHVYCGHTPQPGGNIGYYGHFTCLDTCCFGGFWLSALDVGNQQVWQVSREGHLRHDWQPLQSLWKFVRRPRS